MYFAVGLFMIPMAGPLALSSYMQYRDRKRMEAGIVEPPIKMNRPDTKTIADKPGPYFNKRLQTATVAPKATHPLLPGPACDAPASATN